jgi:nicotinamidase/pyrazinamidase
MRGSRRAVGNNEQMAGRILWDVDTQVDFMEPSGKLYVPNAKEVAPAMEQLVDAARAARLVHVASADDHELSDPEISDTPDLRNTYPRHCLRGTRGAEKILETKQRDPLPLSLIPFPPGLIPRLVEGKREILLLKKNFDVFTNPNTDPLLNVLDPDEIIVFGVATDVCDDAAIRGFLQRGRRVLFVEDAARGLDEARTTACTTAWRDRGVQFTTAEEVIASLG